ncbi:MAG: alpha/beta hydrolase [Acidimicrobiia bacterium]|nr:alpha/beta hydrolase [Acidimicrobiia bacterium]
MPTTTDAPTYLTHGKARLALHQLRLGSDPAVHPLLFLHGLGEQAPKLTPRVVNSWPGPIHALDFTGHGHSTVPTGGGYTAEILMGDVDITLAHLGPCTIVGRGLGAYVGLLIAGGRPMLVRGAVLTDGPGLVGGGIRPTSAYIPPVPTGAVRTPDPMALAELSRDVRPPDYVSEYVRLAVQQSDLDDPIAMCTVVRPEWAAAVATMPGVLDTTVTDALERYAVVR